jgi:foldase protein PrsA
MSEKDQQQIDEELLQEQEDIQEDQTDNQVDQDVQVVEDDFQDDELTSTEPEVVHAAPSSRTNKVWMIASIVLLAALIYALIQPPFGKSNESIATVNGVKISKDMLYDEMVKTGGAPILDSMIVEELMNQKAKETGIKVTKEDVDNEIIMFKKGYATDEEWQAVLDQNGTTEDKLRLDIVMQVQIRKLLEDKTPVTDEEISKFYTDNLEAMKTADKTPTLEEKKDEIRYQLVYQKVSELAPAFIDEVKAKADIENSLEVK